jgi:pyruvate-ferredoxin/flavodoxin oxidoreductase
MRTHRVVIDGTEAAARIAHLTNEVIAIYPITPATGMGELADAWSAAGRTNVWGAIPDVMEMQSEAGAAGAVHGALQSGSLTTTFTASQGLLLMYPNMFKIAGELTPTVFHIAARALATHALSIFGDHSDVMAVRAAGWAMLFGSSPQEAQDMAMIAQMATLRARVPFLHVLDGFRTSHEVNVVDELPIEDVRALMDDELVRAHRQRALTPERPVLRGTAQNPDVFFQAREASNPYYAAVPGIVREAMRRFAERTGRAYAPFEYVGAPDAERVVVLMGSGVGAAREAIAALTAAGERVGAVTVRLYRPFDAAGFVQALPASVRGIAVLDRVKEPGATGEPLYGDVLGALHTALPRERARPLVIGGRYGLASKEFTPAMVKAALDELDAPVPLNGFTLGIHDDVSHLSLEHDPSFVTEGEGVTRAVFYGLGSDGTVGATRNSVKIIGEQTDLHAQGYFVYDSKKSGAVTVSHLRFGPDPIASTYLVSEADFVGVHQFEFVSKLDVLTLAKPGATVLLNSPFPADEVWQHLPLEVQEQLLAKGLRLYVIDALSVAREAGLAGRINTVMQACFFALSGVLPKDEAIAQIKLAINRSYGKRGPTVLERNYAAVDASIANLHEVALPTTATATLRRRPAVPATAPDFVQRVTARIIEGHGNLLPVSALPVDGTFPTSTARFERRSIAVDVPIWDADICTQCALCAIACPHAAIRVNAYEPSRLESAPDGFKSVPWKGKDASLEGFAFTVQLAPDDCTGCGVCVDVCPARSKTEVKRKAINMEPKAAHLDVERATWDFFAGLPHPRPSFDVLDPIRASQLREPLFEFSGACAGCGETPYLKLVTQLYGDRMVVANATGCSSIFGGNLPTTPWSQDASGRGPAWSNSLFEDNAEFGLGMRLAVDSQRDLAILLIERLRPHLGDTLATELIDVARAGDAGDDAVVAAQRERVASLLSRLASLGGEGVDAAELDAAKQLEVVAEALVPRAVWIVGGDGWAYDIGSGGLDHVLASGRDVNILVLDTEVYSNTGGQASKSTPRGAIAKFAAAGKSAGKKDLGLIAMSYGNVYVGQIAIGASPLQTVKVLREAATWRGPSLVIAYSHCIAHGIEMSTAMTHQREAVRSGYWPLYRFDPRQGMGDLDAPFSLDSRKPNSTFKDFAAKEGRFAMLARAHPERAEDLFRLAQADIDSRWQLYEQMAGVQRNVPDGSGVRDAAAHADEEG